MNTPARTLSIVAALAAGALALGGCAGSAALSDSAAAAERAPGDDIIIGALHPVSGANAVDGQQMRAAAQMAIDDANAAGAGDFDDAELVLDAADTKGDVETGSAEATRLIQDGATALVGSFQSATSANIAATAERNGVPFVMDVSALDSILEQGYTYSFRVQPSGGIMGERAAEYLREIADDTGADVEKIGYLYEQGNFGVAAYQGFVRASEAAGLEVTNAISYDPAASDYSTQVQQALAGGVDILAVSGYYNDGLLISKAVESIAPPELKAVYGVANGGYDQVQFMNSAPRGGAGYMNANYAINPNNERAQDVAERFETAFGQPMRTSAALTYDAVSIITQAIADAESAVPADVRDAIADSDYEPIIVNDGPSVDFDETGQNANATVAVVQILNDQIVPVHPTDAASAEPVLPAFGDDAP